MNERTIWNEKQNHPELIVQDCRGAFNLTPEQCEQLRVILMRRGVNKWFFARRRFIKLKHEVKTRLRQSVPRTPEHRIWAWVNEQMQNIARMPRWVEWPRRYTKNWKDTEREIVVRGRHC